MAATKTLVQVESYFYQNNLKQLTLACLSEWGKKAAAIVAKIVLTCTDRNASFLLDIQNGRVAVHDVAPDVPADFKFEGTYEAWTQLGKGEKDFQGLVLGGRIRFRGSMPKVMALMGPLSRITQLAQQVPKEF